MRIGLPREIKTQEYRVGLTPSGVRELSSLGHQVLVQTCAGERIGFPDELYTAAGATIIQTAGELFEAAEMVVKVKEPQPDECRMLRPGQTLFAFLHLAPDPQQAQLLVESQASCVAYETVTSSSGGLPLLAPMSEVAGRLSVQAGAHHLQIEQGGSGVLLGGLPGVLPGQVLILGGGVVGTNAARIALGMGAQVTVLDKSIERLRQLDNQFEGRLQTRLSTRQAIEQHAIISDLIVGSVLVPGASAPKLLQPDLLKQMKTGSVLVDVAIDQGGCFETSRPTTHENPTFVEQGILHYCVANIPGAVARTSTIGLTNATLAHVTSLANQGLERAMQADPHLANGLNVYRGKVTHPAVAKSLGAQLQRPDFLSDPAPIN